MKDFPGREIYSLGNCAVLLISAEDYRRELHDLSATWSWMSGRHIDLEMGSQDAYVVAVNRVTGDTLGQWRGTITPVPTKRRRWWQRWSSPPRTIEEAIDCGRRTIEAQCAINDEMSLRIEAKMEELALRREAMRELDVLQIAPDPPVVANGDSHESLANPGELHNAPRALAKVPGS